jgi:serine/threonine-protein kinase
MTSAPGLPTFPEARDQLVGTSIDDRYKILGILGRGGMGVVYDGVHQHLGRPVAIKVLSAGIADNEVAVQRFLREARTASGLTHGNIVDVSDLGRLPDGRPYLVMPKMEGEDLTSLLQRLGPQTPARVTQLLRGPAAALDLIHAKGYVHRDIKPENLMHVRREDGSEAVMVLDFGIVGLVSGNSKRLTAENSVFGTPAYLPPEVIEGETMDRRGDVYALATCAFELMTDRLPFDAENPVRILPMKLMQNAPRLSEACGVAFPEAIERVIARALHKKPNMRPESAGAFVKELEDAVNAGASAVSVPPPASIPPRDREEAQTGRLIRVPPTSEMELDLWNAAPSAVPNHAPQNDAGLALPEIESRPPLDAPVVPKGRGRAIAVFAGGAAALLLVVWAMMPSGSAKPVEKPIVVTPKPEAAPTPAPAPVAVPSPAVQEPVPTEPAATAPSATAAPPTAAIAAKPRPSATATTNKRPVAPPPSAAVVVKPIPAPTPVAVAPAPATPSYTGGQTAPELNKAAMQALVSGHLALAAELYTRATQADPRSDAAFRGLGLVNERLGKKFEAVRAFRKALELAPNGPQAPTIRARLQALEN